MNPLLLFTLLCPDTAYFREPFPVQIAQSEPAPPGSSSPTAWEARSGMAGIVGSGSFPAGTDSLRVSLGGPGDYFTDKAHASIAIGSYDPAQGRLQALPGASCQIVMRERVSTRARLQGLKAGQKAYFLSVPYTLNGRRLK